MYNISEEIDEQKSVHFKACKFHYFGALRFAKRMWLLLSQPNSAYSNSDFLLLLYFKLKIYPVYNSHCFLSNGT